MGAAVIAGTAGPMAALSGGRPGYLSMTAATVAGAGRASASFLAASAASGVWHGGHMGRCWVGCRNRRGGIMFEGGPGREGVFYV